MKKLKDRVALVTGAASGIGRAISLNLASEGVDVVIADVNEDGLRDTAEEIKSLGRRALPVRADISKREEVEELCQQALKEFGQVDILINNAGVALYAALEETDLSDWEWIMGINLWGPIYTVHYLLPRMIERKTGYIVNISSWAGLLGQPGNGAYSATKFGVVGLSEVLRIELERHGIGVTVVCPGVVRTNIFKSLRLKGFSQDVRKIPPFVGITPERIAKRITRAIKKNRAQVITGIGKFGYGLKRLSPTLARQIGRGGLKVFDKYKDNS